MTTPDIDTRPAATVVGITAHDGAWIVTAICPDGRPVVHGAGPISAPPSLGHRVSHCSGLPATRRRPACTHGDYELRPTA